MLRGSGSTIEILVFRHPKAGTQLVKGSVEAGESASDAALRELVEESGLAGRLVRSLGSSAAIDRGQLWHFFLCEADAAGDSWVHHAADDGGYDFAFGWWPLVREPDAASWHPIFVRALAYVRSTIIPPDSC